MKRLLALVVCLMMLLGTTASLAEMKTDDLFVLQSGGVDIPNYTHDQKLVYGSPLCNYITVIGKDGTELRYNDCAHSLHNLVNAPFIGDGNAQEPYASIVLYCVDLLTQVGDGKMYRCINPEEYPGITTEDAGRLRAIMRASFPNVADMDALTAKVNQWLEKTDGADYTPVQQLTPTECITATQSTIWTITNDAVVLHPFLGRDPGKFGSASIMYSDYMDIPHTSYTRGNIASLIRYLTALPAEEADEELVNEDSFLSTAAAFTNEAAGDATVTVRLKVTNRADGDLKLFATEGTSVSEPVEVKNGEHSYTLKLSNVKSIDDVTLTVEGNQSVSDVFFFVSKDGTDDSQSLGGMTTATVPVRAVVVAQRGANADPDAPAVPQTGDAMPLMQLLLMLTGSAGACLFLRRRSR